MTERRPVLYHGTRVAFGRGGLVLPGDHVAADNHGLASSDWVYVTDDLDLAWHYAEVAAGDGEPRVLVVQPFGLIEVDDSTIGGEEQSAYRCEWARVVRVETRRPT